MMVGFSYPPRPRPHQNHVCVEASPTPPNAHNTPKLQCFVQNRSTKHPPKTIPTTCTPNLHTIAQNLPISALCATNIPRQVERSKGTFRDGGMMWHHLDRRRPDPARWPEMPPPPPATPPCTPLPPLHPTWRATDYGGRADFGGWRGWGSNLSPDLGSKVGPNLCPILAPDLGPNVGPTLGPNSETRTSPWPPARNGAEMDRKGHLAMATKVPGNTETMQK